MEASSIVSAPPDGLRAHLRGMWSRRSPEDGASRDCGGGQVVWHWPSSESRFPCTAPVGAGCSAVLSCCWSTQDARPVNRTL